MNRKRPKQLNAQLDAAVEDRLQKYRQRERDAGRVPQSVASIARRALLAAITTDGQLALPAPKAEDHAVKLHLEYRYYVDREKAREVTPAWAAGQSAWDYLCAQRVIGSGRKARLRNGRLVHVAFPDEDTGGPWRQTSGWYAPSARAILHWWMRKANQDGAVLLNQMEEDFDNAYQGDRDGIGLQVRIQMLSFNEKRVRVRMPDDLVPDLHDPNWSKYM